MYRFLACAVVLFGAAAVATPAWGQVDANGLRELLDAGWQKSVRSRDEVTQLYARLKAASPAEIRVSQAYLAALLKQSRYPEALKAVDEVLARDKKNVEALQIRAWLLVITKDYNAAMGDMQRLGDLLPPQEAPGEAEQVNRDIAAYLGRLCGFMEGPARDAVDELSVTRCRERILSRLITPRQEVFEQARRGVIAQFTGAAEGAEQDKAAAEADAARLKEQKVDQASRAAQDAAARVAEAESREQAARSERDKEIDRIATAERALLPRFAQVEGEAARVRTEISIIDGRIADCLRQAEREEDELRRAFWRREAARWGLERDRWLASLGALDRQYAMLNAERLGLQQRRASAEARYAREAGGVDQARRTADRARLAVTNAEKTAVSGNTPGVRDQKRRALAMTSYVPLPLSLDAMRERLLDEKPLDER